MFVDNLRQYTFTLSCLEPRGWFTRRFTISGVLGSRSGTLSVLVFSFCSRRLSRLRNPAKFPTNLGSAYSPSCSLDARHARWGAACAGLGLLREENRSPAAAGLSYVQSNVGLGISSLKNATPGP